MGNCCPQPVSNNNTRPPSPANDEPPPPPDRAAAAIPPSGEIQTPNLKMFPFDELKSATRNFRPDTVLGEGGFGRVFKGYIDEKTLAPSRVGVGMPVAVKKSNPDSEQGLKEWQDPKCRPDMEEVLRNLEEIGRIKGRPKKQRGHQHRLPSPHHHPSGGGRGGAARQNGKATRSY
ncbi:hypothetical protein SASPL_113320 [Salvia splendens]|uniref:Uncharacterized protein n=1 Tax=Salvia splendens TaxID=180675 RepID=A0A8X8ZZE3_SALSN|nr:hypothetical protein SASPL_113320 [Salvia splendens]